jgi:hypothetical protein
VELGRPGDGLDVLPPRPQLELDAVGVLLPARLLLDVARSLP